MSHAVTSKINGLWHTRMNNPNGVGIATATHLDIGDSYVWAKNLGAITYEVTDPTFKSVNKFFEDAGMCAGAAAKDSRLVARVNHLDNFIHFIHGYIDYGIYDAFDDTVPGHKDWINFYTAQGTHKGEYRRNNPFVRAITTKLYEELRKP